MPKRWKHKRLWDMKGKRWVRTEIKSSSGSFSPNVETQADVESRFRSTAGGRWGETEQRRLFMRQRALWFLRSRGVGWWLTDRWVYVVEQIFLWLLNRDGKRQSPDISATCPHIDLRSPEHLETQIQDPPDVREEECFFFRWYLWVA